MLKRLLDMLKSKERSFGDVILKDESTKTTKKWSAYRGQWYLGRIVYNSFKKQYYAGGRLFDSLEEAIFFLKSA